MLQGKRINGPYMNTLKVTHKEQDKWESVTLTYLDARSIYKVTFAILLYDGKFIFSNLLLAPPKIFGEAKTKFNLISTWAQCTKVHGYFVKSGSIGANIVLAPDLIFGVKLEAHWGQSASRQQFTKK